MKQYDNAILEYELEDDEGKQKLVLAHFGNAVYSSQCLEETFSIMLWTDRIFKKKIKTKKEVNTIIESVENSKKTMGNFINEIKQSYNLPEPLEKELEIILERRNYLVHKFFKLEIDKMYSDYGRKEIIKYFCNFIDDSKDIDKRLYGYYKNYLDRLGVTEERIEELMIELEKQELEREKTAVNSKS
ncbi:hypothetical protein [Marinifilum sp. D714]|uniref:hypothetical protein n=1 Tax=Marinifilum sp. D714 TaxID=2937523 RepID=UPI0027BE880C|nr:hypothetical protein [Marinifilum sp. D714]MDQ2178935.1 hypothetical protein [Marinifilum sp. D714]